MDNIQNIINNLATKASDLSFSKPIFVHYISNPDGSVRWLWPTTSKKPLFLKFYLVQGWKAHLFFAVVKLVFALRLQRLVFKSAQVSITPSSINEEIVDNTDWALFTGTIGPNQKYILYQEDATALSGSFTKIGLTPQSNDLIAHEKDTIEKLSKSKYLSFQLPVLKFSQQQSITLLENPDFTVRNAHWTKQHQLFVNSMKNIDPRVYSYTEFDHLHQLSQRITSLKNSRKKVPSGIIKKLDYLHQSLSYTTVETNFTHGDFTTWNTYSNKKGELYVYDWELANEAYPKGFDLFHFIIQHGILVSRQDWSAIKEEITNATTSFLSDHEVQKYLSLYLLMNIINYLEVYENQKDWHTQIDWLIETWNMGLSDVLRSSLDERELVILDIFDHLHYQPYSGLKLNDRPEKLSEYSDLDLLMNKSVSSSLIKFLKHHSLVKKVKVQSGFAMTKIVVLMQNNQVLFLDNIHQLKRKNMEYMSVADLIARPYTDRDGIKKVGLMDKLQFLGLFYGLNHALIPSIYDAYVDLLNTGNHRLDILINDQFYSKIPNTKALKNEIKKLRCNKGFAFLKNTITYLLDTIMNAIYQKGIIITFSGVDGAGKSTIIEKTKMEMEKKMRRRVVVIRHRPSILPILSAWTKGKVEAERTAAETMPRQGQNNNIFSSLIRFSYYYIDYLFGQFYIYFYHVLRGNIVLYDRYYFDFINDSLRSNIRLPKWLLKSGYTFLLKPDLNFFLYANASTILSRKKELDEPTINKLTNEYMDLFKTLDVNKPGRYFSIENIQMEYTAKIISNTIQSKLIYK